jgi:hypothetical protein
MPRTTFRPKRAAAGVQRKAGMPGQTPVKPRRPPEARTAGLSSAVSARLSATRLKPLASWETDTSALSDSLEFMG